MRNIKIIVEYDGTEYHGWQRQPNGITIQEILEEKIASITQEKITLIGSGRTDAGVHAIGQVANFRTESGIEPENLLRGINSMLPSDIAVKDLRDVDDEFHSRYSAKSKVYDYKIHNTDVRSALFRNYSWHLYGDLDLESMRKGSCCLLGEHDFSSFCAANSDSHNHVRNVIACSIAVDHKTIIVTIEADGFLRYMVRNIIGTLVDVGRGKTTPETFKEIMGSKDRTNAGITAPPRGLFLREVKY
jgi:tRNA pseudouridine38-40 synthase